LIAVYNP